MTGDPAPLDAPNILAALSDVLTPYAVRTAATLRLADHVAAGVVAVSKLATATGTDPRVLTALVRHLADRGVLTLIGDSVGLTAVGELLRSGVPGSWRAHLDLTGAPGLVQQTWSRLPDTVRTGGPSFAGGDFWAVVGGDDELAASFADWLGDWADEWVPAVAAAVTPAPGTRVLDVGGGDGRLLSAVLARHPSVGGTLVELPATARRAAERLAAADFHERVIVHEGSFFDPLPPAETVVLAQVLHDWPDVDAARLLAGAAAAASPDGRVVLVERLADAGSAPAMDLLMASLFGSHERSAAELDALSATAGLVPVGRSDTGTGLHLCTYRLPDHPDREDTP